MTDRLTVERLSVLAFWLIFITLMLPPEVRIIPTYTVMSAFGVLS